MLTVKAKVKQSPATPERIQVKPAIHDDPTGEPVGSRVFAPRIMLKRADV
jgi:hypothetical protein